MSPATMSEEERRAKHAAFIARLRKSMPAVHAVAAWLHWCGFDVWLKRRIEAKNEDDWENYVDDGDLAIMTNGVGPWLRIDVKGLGYDFTSRADWPFNDYIAYRKCAWDRMVVLPFSIISVNKALTHVAMIPGMSASRWYVEERWNKLYRETQAVYLAPFEVVEFVDMRAKVRELTGKEENHDQGDADCATNLGDDWIPS